MNYMTAEHPFETPATREEIADEIYAQRQVAATARIREALRLHLVPVIDLLIEQIGDDMHAVSPVEGYGLDEMLQTLQEWVK